MTAMSSRRPKLVLFPRGSGHASKPGATEEDYAIYASYRPCSGGGYLGTLKVVRLTDARLLFPFDGAEEIGPFATQEAARDAAEARGKAAVSADMRFPEK